MALVLGVQVSNDDKRKAGIRRHIFKEALKWLQAASGRANADNEHSPFLQGFKIVAFLFPLFADWLVWLWGSFVVRVVFQCQVRNGHFLLFTKRLKIT